jgi:Escherichia/Staphylococcus phage prohead protease
MSTPPAQILAMEIRSVDVEHRTLVGRCIPYDETSYLVPDPRGERVLRGAFSKSISEKRAAASRVFLYRNHDRDHAIGHALDFVDAADGLLGTFEIRASTMGDEALEEVRTGYLPALSAGFRTIRERRAKDGAREIVEAALVEVSLLSTPAYQNARVLELRQAADREKLLADLFPPRPEIDLTPIPGLWT